MIMHRWLLMFFCFFCIVIYIYIGDSNCHVWLPEGKWIFLLIAAFIYPISASILGQQPWSSIIIPATLANEQVRVAQQRHPGLRICAVRFQPDVLNKLKIEQEKTMGTLPLHFQYMIFALWGVENSIRNLCPFYNYHQIRHVSSSSLRCDQTLHACNQNIIYAWMFQLAVFSQGETPQFQVG
jgi:hypothetical protein